MASDVVLWMMRQQSMLVFSQGQRRALCGRGPSIHGKHDANQKGKNKEVAAAGHKQAAKFVHPGILSLPWRVDDAQAGLVVGRPAGLGGGDAAKIQQMETLVALISSQSITGYQSRGGATRQGARTIGLD
jgi:hypothetical protein